MNSLAGISTNFIPIEFVIAFANAGTGGGDGRLALLLGRAGACCFAADAAFGVGSGGVGTPDGLLEEDFELSPGALDDETLPEGVG